MAIKIGSSNHHLLHHLHLPITASTTSTRNSVAGGGGGERKKPPPVFISANPSHINLDSLSALYRTCSHSPLLRLPSAEIDAAKLAVAVAHSSVVVSVFARIDGGGGDGGGRERELLWGRMLPGVERVTPRNGELVGFGRAVSDLGLTASIHDVMVIPPLRLMGIGRMIVQRILRNLCNRGIYDISVLCSEKERLFFEACGFGDDILGSTTMLYIKADSTDLDEHEIITENDDINDEKFTSYTSVEVCLISARGLPRSSLWKHQWYAVGWIDPENKYCTKIDASGNPNPVWKTKFTTVVDLSESDFRNLALQIEVYSREPVFLREKLRGTATVSLKEFLAKYRKNSEGSEQGKEDVGSFQLRKKSSDKPLGFIDVSIRISEQKEVTSSYSHLGSEEGFNLRNGNNNITLAGPMQAYPTGQAKPPFQMPGKPHPPPNHPYTHPEPYPINYSHPSVGGPSYPQATGPSYPPATRPSYAPATGPSYPPPPPPPSNVGYMPTYQPTSYINMPPSGAAAGRGVGVGPGFGAGLGVGALAAGAVMYGDDIMSGFQLPGGLRHPSLSISIDPPF